MARELGLNPKKFGGLANHQQEPWKKPLPEFIEEIYFKRFKKPKPDQVRSIEEIAATKRAKKIAVASVQAIGDNDKNLSADDAVPPMSGTDH